MPAVYLYDIFGDVSPKNKTQIIRKLNGYLTQCASQNTPAMVASWSDSDPTPSELDILVYILPFARSVVRKKYPNAPSPISGHSGLTYPVNNQPTISEVYNTAQSGELLAMLIFHEIMHMKLRLGNEMHSQGGLASACVGEGNVEIGGKVVTCSNTLSTDNINKMRVALKSTRVKQWADGIQILKQQKAAIDAGDIFTSIME